MITIIKRLETAQTMFPLADYAIDEMSNGYYFVSQNEKPVKIVKTLEEARGLIPGYEK